MRTHTHTSALIPIMPQLAAVQLISQLVVVHGPQDILSDLFGPRRTVLLNHQVHNFCSVSALQPASWDRISLHGQETLEVPQII